MGLPNSACGQAVGNSSWYKASCILVGSVPLVNCRLLCPCIPMISMPTVYWSCPPCILVIVTLYSGSHCFPCILLSVHSVFPFILVVSGPPVYCSVCPCILVKLPLYNTVQCAPTYWSVCPMYTGGQCAPFILALSVPPSIHR